MLLKRIKTKKKQIQVAVEFFIKNKTQGYISHGEVLSGRAESFTKWSKNLPSVLNSELSESTGFLVYNDSKLVALTVMKIVKPCAVIEDIIVSKAYRGRGIGKDILTSLHEIFRKRGVRFVLLESGVRNTKAHKFFKGFGYTSHSVVLVKSIKP